MGSAARGAGTRGPTGTTGPAGPQGIPGAAGAQGEDGLIAFTGEGPPLDSLGGASDWYFDTVNGDLYGPKGASAWPDGISVVATGPTGPQGPAGEDGTPGGPQGEQGEAGPTGPIGPTGNPGSDGLLAHEGSGAPSSGHGVDGDFYLDRAAGELYGPKTAGAWGTPVSLVGIRTNRNAAPSSGELAAGEVVFWWDPTNGNAKPMYTGKSLNGTLVTGALI